MGFRISVDTGGTFTDVIVADEEGALHLAKAPTDLARAFQSIENALAQLEPELGVTVAELLGRTDVFTYGTTRATNAIVEGRTARTAFFTTEGFPGHPAAARGRQARAVPAASRIRRPTYLAT